MSRPPLISAVGFLESCFKEKFGSPRQPRLVPASRATLRVKPEFIPEQSLKGLSEFSHVWLLSYFHLNTNKRFVSTVHPPRLRGKTVGVFASRSPHRPSPIGLSLARLDRVEGDTLHLSGIDLVDGTPIIDVKPYIPAYDRASRARKGWTAAVAEPRFSVRFSKDALEAARQAEAERPGFRALIRQVLSRDVRNPRDKSQSAEGKELDCWLYDHDVCFQVRGREVLVTRLEPAKDYKRARKGDSPLG